MQQLLIFFTFAVFELIWPIFDGTANFLAEKLAFLAEIAVFSFFYVSSDKYRCRNWRQRRRRHSRTFAQNGVSLTDLPLGKISLKRTKKL